MSDTTIIHNIKYYKLIVRGYMFRLLMQPSSGQLQTEQVPLMCAQYGIPQCLHVWYGLDINLY